VVLNNVILSTPIVCIVLVIVNIFIILHGHTMKLGYEQFRKLNKNYCELGFYPKKKIVLICR